MLSASPAAIIRSRYSFRGEFIERGALPTLAISAVFAVVVVAGVAAGVLGYDGQVLTPIFTWIFILWAGGLGLQLLGFLRSGEAVKALCYYLCIFVGGILASAVLAVVSRDYADATFIANDRALFFGFDWKADVPAMTRNPFAGLILSHAYASIDWQPFFAIAYLFAAGKTERFWLSLSATSIALGICVAIFPLCPALGGYVHFHIPRESMPNVLVQSAWHYPEVLLALKDGTVHSLGARILDGIIAMPSFHAASAIILAWTFWTTRLRWPFLALNLTMLVSSVPIGGHYIVDVIAGMASALFSIWLASRLLITEAKTAAA